MSKYNPQDLRRHIFFEKNSREYIVSAYYDLPETILVMAVKRHKSKSMAVSLAMRAARWRTMAGDFEAVK